MTSINIGDSVRWNTVNGVRTGTVLSYDKETKIYVVDTGSGQMTLKIDNII